MSPKGVECERRDLTAGAEHGEQGVCLRVPGVALAGFPRTPDEGVGVQGWVLILTFESVTMKVGVSKFLGLKRKGGSSCGPAGSVGWERRGREV